MKALNERKRKHKKRNRLPQAERIVSILQAALPLFAQEGLEGTRTSSLCKSAGISVGLIYRYFPSKQELFAEVLEYCLKLSNDPFRTAVSDLEPGSDAIAFLINAFITDIFLKHKNEEIELAQKLILRNMSADGKFAKKYIRKKLRSLFPIIKTSIEVCIKNKELPANRSWKNWRDVTWIIRHLLIVFSFFPFSFPKQKLYSERIESLRFESVRFCLLAVGFSPEATEILVKKVAKQSVLVI
ncbi:transcriptional regulator, TetR family [Leptospira inadai serovar Lyme str. 10]|uniref:Transcriptional regulator, TetR family n=2 Tax=Leptospira inadai serovar Lyme TaxID=293084 RepID=V6HCC5_9LEPT|nr:TetR/AcrR family transcriptional regulator [Leptospira inadai]EQA36478.1 transcriptional regulator, TetR family [Leptospira inadai serovar Lyme str. 10]PNV75593.1 TetR/AcrR family transcriptional regulator [Leptospira inadai serovar Lyme]